MVEGEDWSEVKTVQKIPVRLGRGRAARDSFGHFTPPSSLPPNGVCVLGVAYNEYVSKAYTFPRTG